MLLIVNKPLTSLTNFTYMLFKKFVHPSHLLKMIFGNSTKIRMTHSNISVAVNPVEIISHNPSQNILRPVDKIE